MTDIESRSTSKEKFSAFSSIYSKSFQKTLQNSQGRPSDPGVFLEAMLFKASRYSFLLRGPSQTDCSSWLNHFGSSFSHSSKISLSVEIKSC